MSPPTNKHGICWTLRNCLPFRSTWVHSPLILIESLAFWFCSIYLFVFIFFLFLDHVFIYLHSFTIVLSRRGIYCVSFRYIPVSQKDKATADNADNAGQFTIYQRLLILKTFYDRYARLIKFTAAGINP